MMQKGSLKLLRSYGIGGTRRKYYGGKGLRLISYSTTIPIPVGFRLEGLLTKFFPSKMKQKR